MKRVYQNLWVKALLWQLAVWLLCLLVLFGAAGRLSWLPGWVFFTTFFGFVGGLSISLLRKNASLLAERLVITCHDQPAWDRVWILSFYLLSLAWLALMPFDVARLRWSQMPTFLQGIGLMLFLGSLLGIFLTIRANHYLSPVVRLQEERGQVVISTGPYAYLRHPLYASAFLFYLGVPMFLGSWWGVWCAPLFLGLLTYRAVREERWLCARLPGYQSYMQRVTRRFLPGVW
jgi:protein-S-isoprenylcysteine O-methyltransferase Ste14